VPLDDPGAVDLGFVQGDVADQLQQEPGFNDRFVVVRSIAGDAVLLVMTPETAAVRNWAGSRTPHSCCHDRGVRPPTYDSGASDKA
jgi:hypothetical protein